MRSWRRLLLAAFLLLLLARLAAAAAFILQSDGWHAPAKAAGATLDYGIDDTAWLAGDTIVSSAWTADAGITAGGGAINAAAVTYTNANGQKATAPPGSLVSIWLSGGTAGQTYQVTNTFTTAGGRTQVQSFKITVNNQ